MPIKIIGGKISNCGIGVKTEGPVDLEVNGLMIEKARKAYDLAENPKRARKSRDLKSDIGSQIIAGLVVSAIVGAVGLMWHVFS